MGMDICGRQLLKRSTAVIVMLVILCLLVSCGDAGRTNTGEDASTGAGTDTGTGAGNGTGTDIPPVNDTICRMAPMIRELPTGRGSRRKRERMPMYRGMLKIRRTPSIPAGSRNQAWIRIMLTRKHPA